MLKPMDILKAEFKQSFKGYNVEEVDAFVAKVVTQYETLIQENKRLEEEIEDLKAQLQEYHNKEQDIHGLLALTKEACIEAKEVANQHAESILEEARLQAKIILDKAELAAKQQLNELYEEIKQQKAQLRVLLNQEKQFKERVRQLMEAVWGIIETSGKTVEVEANDDFKTRVYRELASTETDVDLD